MNNPTIRQQYKMAALTGVLSGLVSLVVEPDDLRKLEDIIYMLTDSMVAEDEENANG